MTKNTQVLLSVSPRIQPSLKTMKERAQGDSLIEERQKTCLRLWEECFGVYDGSNGYGDYEDWTEQAYRLWAAQNSFGKENVWISFGADTQEAVNMVSGEKINRLNPPSHFIHYGSQPQNLYHYNSQKVERLADSYAESDVFAAFANRKFFVGGFSTDGKGMEIYDAVLTLHSSGVRRIIVKNTRAKKGFYDIYLPDEMTVEDLRSILFEELDWSLVREEGRPGAFLVQEYSPMFYEYRFFVVGHELTTGAGCIEEHTPLNNSEPFNPLLRVKRSDWDAELVVNSQVFEKLFSCAQNIVEMTKNSEPECIHYVIDVALDADGEPLMIERNAMLNSGFYASNPVLITDRLKALSGPVCL